MPRPAATFVAMSRPGGVLPTCDDSPEGVEAFGTRIQPLMRSAAERGEFGRLLRLDRAGDASQRKGWLGMSRRGCTMIVLTPFLLISAAAGWLTWRGSDSSLPPLARGMGSTFAEGDRQFKARVLSRFPIGSPEPGLLAELQRQGFKITMRGSAREAMLGRFIGCGDKEWRVEWRASEGRIAEISALYGADCL